MRTGSLRILEAGIAAVTDLGRVRGPRYGLPVNGALDQYSARVANILCANSEEAPLIEVTAFDFAVTSDEDLLIAVTGATMDVEIDSETAPMWEPLPLQAGRTLRLSGMTQGMRTYVAIHGAFDVEFLLGSCAPDLVIDFGTVLTPATELQLSPRNVVPADPHLGRSLFNFGLHPLYLGGVPVVDVIDGPDIADFGSTAFRIFGEEYMVTEKSNHVGLRLTGGPLPERQTTTEKISRGVPIGAVEVPPGEELLILHRGRGVTAGYPVLGVVTTTSLDTLGQVRPGQSVVFRRTDLYDAVEEARYWRTVLDDLTARTALVFSAIGLGGRLGLEAHA